MRVINYFDSDKQSHWLSEIKRGDWGATGFLHESLAEYEKRRETKLGRLIANREMPILKKANEIMSKL